MAMDGLYMKYDIKEEDVTQSGAIDLRIHSRNEGLLDECDIMQKSHSYPLQEKYLSEIANSSSDVPAIATIKKPPDKSEVHETKINEMQQISDDVRLDAGDVMNNSDASTFGEMVPQNKEIPIKIQAMSDVTGSYSMSDFVAEAGKSDSCSWFDDVYTRNREVSSNVSLAGNITTESSSTSDSIDDSSEINETNPTLNTAGIKFKIDNIMKTMDPDTLPSAEAIKTDSTSPEMMSSVECIEEVYEAASPDDGSMDLEEICNDSSDAGDKKPYKCTFCSKEYTTASRLEVHMKVHTAQKPYQCSVCTMSFHRPSRLSIHMKIHTSEKLFSCEVCSKKFLTSGNLVQHLKTHTGEKPFTCSVCNKGFTRMSNMSIHMRTHTDEKPFQCTTCGKGFYQYNNLVLHTRSHTGEKPYECKMCGKRYIASGSLSAHMRLHTGEKLFRCPVCDKSFVHWSRLSRHMTIHSKILPVLAPDTYMPPGEADTDASLMAQSNQECLVDDNLGSEQGTCLLNDNTAAATSSPLSESTSAMTSDM